MMRALPLAFLFALTVAGAQPVELLEPGDPDETVTIPKATLIKLIDEYKKQKALNILLWERQEEINDRLDRWRVGTNCT